MFNAFKKPLDFLAIGDTVTDAFIELEDAKVSCDINHENCTLSMRFGDKIPYKGVTIVSAVGNSPNAAVAAKRLGLRSAVLTDLGDDGHGKECLETFKKEGIPTEYVRIHHGKTSNYHYVLMYEAERTILVKHESYEYQFPDLRPAPRWMYLSSLGENSEEYHARIADYLERHEETNLAFQPGTFQMKLGFEKLSRLYKRSAVFFCNKEEAEKILKKSKMEIQDLLEGIHALGPKIAVITDGPRGAYTFDGKESWFIPMYPDPKPPISRTGAGDAFAATFTAALSLGKSIPEALRWGPVNSMSVVQKIGAQGGLLERDALETLLEKAPSFYTPVLQKTLQKDTLNV